MPLIFQERLLYPWLGTWLILFVILTCAFAVYVAIQHRAVSTAVRDSDMRFRTFTEAIPQIVWTAGADGLTNYINNRWYEVTGADKSGTLGTAWMEMLHPDDREPCRQKWLECLRFGRTFEIEYRLRDASGRYRWYLDRAVPLRDAAGIIIQWFGTCTEIDDRMRNQQLLEQQIKARTGELFEANTRLQEEMRRGR